MNWVSTTSGLWNSIGTQFWTNPYTPEPWIISTALANNQEIVTLHDNANIKDVANFTQSNLSPNINFVAKHFHIQTITLPELMYKLNKKF
ncbi:hypothetical protein [Acetilactobacillus jinshanensis]|uniref:Uncharacterized protein n=1 Tax=Acetilactobacillus jinshanensis TaxID=1720083 RepID=A0A4P6ZKA1_9LACO|nr:hypothetical protein [Acetilactobacillus jinshanensis]QBP17670.1 hypothetical protein ELX58_00390 [Acetilactobacillus jinshanensis]URL61786.1 hypothetical protein HGK75_07560 [uncultured bacterium]